LYGVNTDPLSDIKPRSTSSGPYEHRTGRTVLTGRTPTPQSEASSIPRSLILPFIRASAIFERDVVYAEKWNSCSGVSGTHCVMDPARALTTCHRVDAARSIADTDTTLTWSSLRLPIRAFALSYKVVQVTYKLHHSTYRQTAVQYFAGLIFKRYSHAGGFPGEETLGENVV